MKKKGRPKGHKNMQYADTFQMGAVCVKCGSTDFTQVKGSRADVKEISGVLRNGFRYLRIETRRKICSGCGQHTFVRTFFGQQPAENNNI